MVSMTNPSSYRLLFLHFYSILFRDLKPENVASNHHLAHQLFDFGLAKELKPADLVVGKSDEYHLTGLTGTLRIMAPEVIQCQPYGLPADVFSFGIVSWEVFRGGQNQLTAMEVSQQNQRPEFPSNETPLEDLIQRCWAANTNDRLTFDDICEELQYRLSGLDKEHNLDQTSPSSISRRSEYLRRLSQESSEADPVFYVK